MIAVLAKGVILLVALLHLYFLWLEMFAWTTKAKKVFRGFPKELFEPTKALAANQGLYNGFLAAGLLWSLLIQDTQWQVREALFFLACVSLAGLYGGFQRIQKDSVRAGLPRPVGHSAVVGAVILAVPALG